MTRIARWVALGSILALVAMPVLAHAEDGHQDANPGKGVITAHEHHQHQTPAEAPEEASLMAWARGLVQALHIHLGWDEPIPSEEDHGGMHSPAWPKP